MRNSYTTETQLENGKNGRSLLVRYYVDIKFTGTTLWRLVPQCVTVDELHCCLQSWTRFVIAYAQIFGENGSSKTHILIGALGSNWERLGVFGRYWEHLRALGSIWERLGAVGKA